MSQKNTTGAEAPQTRPQRRMSECLRRLHLDFHNPPGIPDLCADFDAREFAATIRKAGFDSVTVFALDSHGHCYTQRAGESAIQT